MNLSYQQMRDRLVRYADLVPCRNAFVDTRTPGSEQKENFTIIGPGVSENPEQHVHIAEPHGFNIGAARQPGGCLNSQHSHESAEVFVVHSGRWRFQFGPEREDGHLDAGPGDVASVPIHMFRGFEKLDEGTGFLWVALGRDDPGKVTWAPSVFQLAEHYGLRLLRGGRLVDTTVGETVPPDAELEQPPTPERVAELKTPPMARLAECVVRAETLAPEPKSLLAANGVEECPVITPKQTGDGFSPGPIVGWWPHGFNLRCLRIRSRAVVPGHFRDEPEVIFIHSGALEVRWPEGELVLAAGDTLTVPAGLARSFRASSSEDVIAYVVRGGDAPAAPHFVDKKAT